MSASSSQGFDVTEVGDAIIVRFLERKMLNDQKMEAVAEQLFRLADKLGRRDLRLDFANVEYVQSSVLGRLVGLHKKVTGGGGRLLLCNINPAVYTVFTVTRLDKLFVIERSQSDDDPEAEPNGD